LVKLIPFIFIFLIPLCSCSPIEDEESSPIIHSVTLNWNQSDFCPLDCYYQIFRNDCDNPETATIIGLAGRKKSSYTDQDVVGGKCYDYGVRACAFTSSQCSKFSIIRDVIVPSIKGPIYSDPPKDPPIQLPKDRNPLVKET